ncbi:hypothetical protein C8J57DRAFT_1573641 [Mycena rebaudengoi]|nr:hypothetical protein C8J57DRAFT_1573641 [Mycena rebaudengoi]
MSASRPMHRCWEVAEITQLIFKQIAAEPDGQVSLSRLARTCRAFLEPGLDLLWREQSSLVPLLSCFSDEFWSIVHWDESQVHIPRGLGLEAWERVLFYAPRIKSLTALDSMSSRVGLNLLQAVHMSIPVEDFLPALEKLCWCTSQDNFPYIRLFLGPRIKTIELTLSAAASQLAILYFLAQKYSSLANVRINCTDEFRADPETLSHAITTLVLALHKVQKLALHSISPKACHHLAALSTLRSLKIHKLYDLPFPNGPESYPVDGPTPFPVLRALSIHAPVSNLGTNFVSILLNASLEHLYIGCGRPATTDESLALFSEINSHCSHTSLTFLHISTGQILDFFQGFDESIHIVTPDVLRPLLVFTNLQTFKLESALESHLDSDFIAAMARAWPQIRHIHMKAPFSTTPTARIGLTDFTSFACYCPNLEYLHIPFTAHALVIPSLPPLPLVSQTSLKTLGVNDAPIESPFAVATFLSAVFPSLTKVTPRDGLMYDTTVNNWREVEKLVPMFASVRVDEEQRLVARKALQEVNNVERM